MNWRKKTIALVLAAALAVLPLSACTKKDALPEETDVEMGRYVEEEWELPVEGENVGIAGLHKTTDGRIGALFTVYPDMTDFSEEEMEAFTGPDYFYYTTTDGADWQEADAPWLEELAGLGSINLIHFNSKGEGVAVYYPNDEDETGYTSNVALLDPDGAVTVTPIGDEGTPWEDPYASMYETMAEDEDEAGDIADADDEEDSADSRQAEAADRGEAAEDASAQGQAEPAAEGGEPEDGNADGVADDEEEQETPSGNRIAGYDSSDDRPEPLYINSVLLGEDGMVYISDYQHVGRFDPETGNMVKDYFPWHGGFTLAGGQVVELMQVEEWQESEVQLNGTTLLFADPESGQETRRIPAQELEIDQNMRFRGGMSAGSLYGEPDGTLYVASSNGLFRLRPDEKELEMLLHGGMSGLSIPSTTIWTFLVHGEEEFLTYQRNDFSSSSLVNYVYSMDVPSEPEHELTIYSLVNDYTLPQAVGAFRSENPNVLVTIQRASASGEDATTNDDFIRMLNTELLAGKGPDLILLDEMPIDSYIDKGVLSDLTEVIQPLIDSGELVGNVAASLDRDGKIYALPTRFFFPALWGEKETIEACGSLSGMTQYAEANSDKPLFNGNYYHGLLLMLSRLYQNTFLDATGKIDTGTLAAFYDDATRLVQTFPQIGMFEYNMEIHDNMWEYRNRYTSTGSVMDLAFGDVDLYLDLLTGVEGAIMPNAAMYKRGGGVADWDNPIDTTTVPDNQVKDIFQAFRADGQGVFFASSIIGVNAAGQQELAIEFVKAMVSPEAQVNDQENGFPVSTKAYTKAMEDEHRFSRGMGDGGYDGVPERNLVGAWPSDAMLNAIRDTFDGLDTPIIENRELLTMIYAEFADVLKGDTAPMEAAESVAQKSLLMLSE